MNDSDILSAFKFLCLGKKIDPARIRTWNPLIRSEMPYPLGHGAAACNMVIKMYIKSGGKVSEMQMS